MVLSKRFQAFILLIGDLILFHAALILTLMSRYGTGGPFMEAVDVHKWPFFYVHLLWIFIFYISGLYDIKKFPSPKIVLSKTLGTMTIAGIAAVLVFYLVPFFEITPKTNLLIDVFLATTFLMLWRRFFWLTSAKASKIKILFFGSSREVEDLANYLAENVQLGYESAVILAVVDHNLIDLIKKHGINLIVASENIMKNETSAQRFYEVLPLGVSTVDFATFYETTMEKIPVSAINESWFLINLVEINKQIYEFAKRIFDIMAAVILGIPTLALIPLMTILIKSESPGPVFYRHARVGKNGKIFEIAKFRSMVKDAEKNGARWADEKDERITNVGKILRKTRIDELPQLWNVLKGEMSFIGPRPERPEFIDELQKQIPHYAMRHLIKPGLTGWAQIKFPYGASVEDAMEKLQYDLYYIKNRSLVLDLAITARTIASVIGREGR